MPKKFIRRFLPEHHTIKEHRHLKVFGRLLHDPNLWHLNRRSVSGAFGVGLFMAWIPLPSQMLVAAALAILFRVNLPISVALVWITNPLTMPPLFFFAYKVGAWLLGVPLVVEKFELSVGWFTHTLDQIWQPYLLGSFVIAIVNALAGYYGMQLVWRWHVVQQWQRKKAQRKGTAAAAARDLRI
jgi:uncharacterized protein (DUF2062 family)